MPSYFDASGRKVDASTATFANGRCKPGFHAVVDDGEAVHMNIALMDAASPNAIYLTDAADPPKSIDEALKLEIASAAKAQGQKPSEWLATQTPKDMERLIESVARKFVSAAGAAGVAGVFQMDASQQEASIALDVAQQRAAHHRKFAWLGAQAPVFDEAIARLVATSKITSDSARAVRDAARAASVLPVAEATYAAAQQRPSDERRNAWKGDADTNRAVRDLARSHQYR
jgi:hypothetical protein